MLHVLVGISKYYYGGVERVQNYHFLTIHYLVADPVQEDGNIQFFKLLKKNR